MQGGEGIAQGEAPGNSRGDCRNVLNHGSADPERCELPRNLRIKLNEKDIARTKELLNYQWFQKPAWQAEVKQMLTSALKCELDALANKDVQYITKKYLLRKLKEKDWLN